MKKLSLMLLGAALLIPNISFADEIGMRKGSYGLAGCGLGSMVWEKNSKTQQVLAATTNGTFGTQTFGISSGTSNCATKDGVVLREKEQEVFVTANFETLTEEMARGEGETLKTFASLLGCSNASDFGKMTQTQYGKISKDTPSDLLNAVKGEIVTDANLSSTCKVQG